MQASADWVGIAAPGLGEELPLTRCAHYKMIK